ncbi:MAG TPA: PLP-dependent aspartate aminotransferase family protein [Pyrinomonadaceae bacterium]|jgi:cystathionine gamma-synthase/methionine-gamma-lyase
MTRDAEDSGDDLRARDINTQFVHAGERLPPRAGRPVATPVYATATYTFDSMSEMDAAFADESAGYVYARYGNPTTHALETALATLEAGAGACAYASGMAAVHAALLACGLEAGATILAAQDLYGATTALLHNVFAKLGVRVAAADFGDAAAVQRAAGETRPRVLLAETISNPLLKVCDLAACAEIARAVGASFVVDNTFATPVLCQPLRFGADVVVHSATKYLGGHGDALGGVAVARDAATHAALVELKKLVGGVLSAWEAHEILRGVKTLGVRLERQCANARRLAERLAEHPRVARVFHPGFGANAAQAALVARVLRPPHTGALVAVELRENTKAAAFRFLDALGLCVRLTSLGDVETCVLHPMTASHRGLAPELRRALGIGDGLVRISVGIEAYADILEDIEQALDAGIS